MDILLFAIQNDWLVIMPIVLCSIWMVAVAIDRFVFYSKNKRDVVGFIHRLQRELQRNSLDNAEALSTQVGGVIGDVAEEGIRVLREQNESFDRSFDITAALASRKLEQRLWMLGTIATIAPYLGLFATVVRILLTFGELSKAGAATQSNEIMFGIASALIATAAGLFVAITAVFLNNLFQTTVTRFEDDFQLLKLLFLSVADARVGGSAAGTPAY